MFSFLNINRITKKLFFSTAIISSFALLSACDNGTKLNKEEATPSKEVTTESQQVVTADEPEEVYGTGHFAIGSTATVEQIAGWDIDVRPDGTGLPDGEGSVEDGEELFEEKCSSCHGSFGEGVKNWPRLSGGQGSLKDERPDKTVGSYWAYASTLWDYINRAMPFPAPQSLEPDEVYAITAYILNLNDLVDDEFVLSKDNFTSVEMGHTKDAFIPDDRPDTANTRCMTDCKETLEIIVTQLMGADADIQVSKDDVSSTSDIHVLSTDAEKGEATYNTTCKACHSIGIAGSPKLGDSKEWGIRFAKGKDVLYENAISGFEGETGFMPAKGGNLSISDEDIKHAVDYMLESSL